VTCRRDDPLLEIHVTGFAGRRQTVTCRSEMRHDPVALEMDTIGGRILRPRERGYSPTFWPVPSRLTLEGASGSVHVSFEAPTAVSFSPSHALEWIVARNPVKERAFGLLPVLAHPIGGTVDERQTHRAALFATPGREVPADVRDLLGTIWAPSSERALLCHLRGQLHCDDPTVSVTAVKRAGDGEGVIVRLYREEEGLRTVDLSISPGVGVVSEAFRCDAREEGLESLAVSDLGVRVPLLARFTTVRLLMR